jgi:hypothetical protein
VPFSVGRVTAATCRCRRSTRSRARREGGGAARRLDGERPAGHEPEIQLRGPTSINATGSANGPLIIVDGAIQNVGSMNELGGLDIESVEVVKGAPARRCTARARRTASSRSRRSAARRGAAGIKFGRAERVRLQRPEQHQLRDADQPPAPDGRDRAGVLRRRFGERRRVLAHDRLEKEIMRINNVAADTSRRRCRSSGTRWPSRRRADERVPVADLAGQYYNPLAQVLRGTRSR